MIDLEVLASDGSTKIITSDMEPSVTHDGEVIWDGSTSGHRLQAVHVTVEIITFGGLNVLFDQSYAAIPKKEKRSFFHRIPLGDGL